MTALADKMVFTSLTPCSPNYGEIIVDPALRTHFELYVATV